MKKTLSHFLLIWALLLTPALHAFVDYAEFHQPYFVGELGANWQFPSDHLPRGATIGNFHIAFWNILNKKYLDHIQENTQGLKNSSILKENIPIAIGSTLTLREARTGQMILEMIYHPTHPRSLIALEETHLDVQKYLKEHLPSNWKIVTPPDQPQSQDIYLYDSNIFEYLSHEAIHYSPDWPKTIFTLTLREKITNKEFRFLQSHIPGGPVNSPEGCAKFSDEALRQFDLNMTMVLMGDMNQSPHVIQRALESAALKRRSLQPYTYLPISYPSHINTKMEASWIDNFFIYLLDSDITASEDPQEIHEDLVSTVHLCMAAHPPI